MTEYAKLVLADLFSHTVEIREKATGKTGVANTCGGRVAVFYGADDGSDDKTVDVRAFNEQFIITAILCG